MPGIFLPESNDPGVRKMHAGIEAGLVACHLEMRKAEDHANNVGVTPTLALARVLVMYQRAGAA